MCDSCVTPRGLVMLKLTERLLKSIGPPKPGKAGQGARDWPDNVAPGLCFTIRSTGVRTWTFRYRFAGDQKRFKIGDYPAMTLLAARKRARDLQDQLDAGIDPQAEKAAVRAGDIADAYPELAVRFVEQYHIPRNRSWMEQARVLGLRLDDTNRVLALKRLPFKPKWEIIAGSPADTWRKRSVGSISRRDIAELVGKVAADRPTAGNKLRVILGRFFGWMVEQGVLENSPVDGTRPPTPAQSRKRVLTIRELALVWHAAGRLSPPFSSFVRMLILTAARRSEVAGMRKAEVDGQLWTIPADRVKNGVEHEVPLSRVAVLLLDKLKPARGGLLFSTTYTTPISGFSKMKRQLDAAVTKFNDGKRLPDWTLHDLRRSVSTGMAEDLGIAPHIIEAVLNHSTIIAGVAATYNRATYRAEKTEALERWADHVFAAWCAKFRQPEQPQPAEFEAA